METSEATYECAFSTVISRLNSWKAILSRIQHLGHELHWKRFIMRFILVNMTLIMCDEIRRVTIVCVCVAHYAITHSCYLICLISD